MEELLREVLVEIREMKECIRTLEQRLTRLEKVDSIEHRVAVNQIDLSDLKEMVEKMDTFQREELLDLSTTIKKGVDSIHFTKEVEQIHSRLDSQLLRIAKNEEAIHLLTKISSTYGAN